MVDQRCRESEGKGTIEGYMSVSDEEAHQWAIIATLSDYTLWHRRMGHAQQHVIKHLGKTQKVVLTKPPTHLREPVRDAKQESPNDFLSLLQNRGQSNHSIWYILIWMKCQFTPLVDTSIPPPT